MPLKRRLSCYASARHGTMSPDPLDFSVGIRVYSVLVQRIKAGQSIVRFNITPF